MGLQKVIHCGQLGKAYCHLMPDASFEYIHDERPWCQYVMVTICSGPVDHMGTDGIIYLFLKVRKSQNNFFKSMFLPKKQATMKP